MAILRNSWTWIIAFIAFSCSALLVEFVSPKPYSQYGGSIFLVCFASLVLFRTLTEVFSLRIAQQALPYIVATFIVLAPPVVFATGMFQIVTVDSQHSIR